MTHAKSKLERIAEHYDATDTSTELEAAMQIEDAVRPSVDVPMATFAVRLPVEVLDRVRAMARRHGWTTSAQIRHWIEAGVAGESGEEDRVVPVGALLDLIGRAPRRKDSDR